MYIFTYRSLGYISFKILTQDLHFWWNFQSFDRSHCIVLWKRDFYFSCHRYKESNDGLKYENLIFSWKYIVWPIKWLEISPGMWILSQNFKTNISLRSMCKYMQKLTLFSDFCKNCQGKFFFKGLHQFSTINCTYSYMSLPLGIFLNSYPVKAHCGKD